ncbi:hypothetical protein FOMG_15168 [Fusarium oxysporum f. sp. melonis 26406]|uniref:Uncharacterized protein n=1 Tax=Fusarium oxysporum f. sp. melonis 26406 TaxID=1089452 RepID=X0A665_FUSOX|nr:hypothetical protein FOMG_15168 [Fusarium oxysporum f. sp. melonis 26406]
MSAVANGREHGSMHAAAIYFMSLITRQRMESSGTKSTFFIELLPPMKRRRTNREPFDVRTFLASTIQARLSLYVQERLRKEPQEIRLKAGRPLLDYALRPDSGAPQETSGLEQGPVAPILRVLLDLGAKPNLRGSGYKKDTPWELFLEFCYQNRVRGKDFAFMENIGAAMEIMIARAWCESRWDLQIVRKTRL